MYATAKHILKASHSPYHIQRRRTILLIGNDTNQKHLLLIYNDTIVTSIGVILIFQRHLTILLLVGI